MHSPKGSNPNGWSISVQQLKKADDHHKVKLALLCFGTAVVVSLVCASPLLGQQPTVPVQMATASGNALPADTLQQASIPQLQERNPRYRIHNGDTISLNFRFTPQFDTTASVQPDGYISLREIGDFKAEGLTLPELNQALQTAYSKILNDPVITATLTDFVKPYFTVSGEVSKPSKYDLHGDTTVAECIAVAGGFTVAAKHSQVLLFRRKNADWVEVHKLNVKRMLNSRDLAEDMHVQSGDLLFVPKSLIAKIGPLIPFNLFRLTFAPAGL
jgi:polysaccharide biosynthesis/export protein